MSPLSPPPVRFLPLPHFGGSKTTRDEEAKDKYQQLSDTRLEGKTQYARSDHHVRDEFKALVWDSEQNRFIERFDVYSDTPKLAPPNW